MRLNIEQLRRIAVLDRAAANFVADAALYCDHHDIRTQLAIDRVLDALEMLKEVITDDEVLQKWVTTL